MRMTLKALRANRNMTQNQAAKAVGVSKDTWANWEIGKTLPNVVSVNKIIDAFGVDYEDIIFGLKPREKSNI
ncbi:helix-turn-helix transcriptional regulator [Pediococcus pentosaceus]|uniref:helix-turn-helix transcriptional regulator n=1 Tax=Pediococcus pentosaceus TaxID=1255 RepID=UPI003982BCB2